MYPGTMTLPLRRNAADGLSLQLMAVDGAGQKVPLDLTSYRLILQVRLYPGAAGEPLLSVSTATGEIAIVDARVGMVEIDWQSIAANIAALPTTAEPGPVTPRVDIFSFDLLLIDPTGRAQAVLEGPVPVSFGVTRL